MRLDSLTSFRRIRNRASRRAARRLALRAQKRQIRDVAAEPPTNAKMELATVVERIVLNREGWFVNFFNKAQAITPRMHAIELIPGIGKKYMWQILNERENGPFKSFENLQQRANIPNPAKLIAKRILEELAGESKYRLFTRAP